jgi:hypothetical protein
VIRQCASRSTLGVAQGCRYFIDEVGLEVAVCVSYLEFEELLKPGSREINLSQLELKIVVKCSLVLSEFHYKSKQSSVEMIKQVTFIN